MSVNLLTHRSAIEADLPSWRVLWGGCHAFPAASSCMCCLRLALQGVLCTRLGGERRCAWGFWPCLRPDGCAMLMRPNKDLPPSTSANAEILRPSRSDAHSLLPQASRQVDVPSPAFLASVVVAIKQALAADQTLMSVESSSSVAGGITATFSSSLQSQASALAVSGVGFPPVLASIAGAANQMQGRPNFVVPSFVSTFWPPAPSVAPSLSSVTAGLLPTVLFLCTKCTCFTAVVRGCTRLFAHPTKTSKLETDTKYSRI